MKQKLLFIYPYKFTDFEYFKLEIDKYKKLNYKVFINDLSEILVDKSLNSAWKSKRSRYAIVQNSILEFYSFLKKNKKNSIVINYLHNHSNFKTFLILLIIKILKIKQLSIFEVSPPYISRKNVSKFKWLIAKLKEHKFNYNVYLFNLNYIFFRFLINIIKNKNEIVFSNLKSNRVNTKPINFFDYSNSLEPSKKKESYKNYCLYLDNGGPYFRGDTDLKKNYLPNYNIKKIYEDIIEFFRKVEKDFKCKVIIIPHPKYKSSKKNFSFNPFFSEFIVDNRPNALNILSKKTKFFLAKGTTAFSYAVTNKKPIVNFFSSEHEYESEEIMTILDYAKLIGNSAYNIKNYSKKSFSKKLNISKKAYKKITFFLLSHKNTLYTPNYKIISNQIEKFRI